jgi:hypothetical protein
MKMAKASDADLDMAIDLASALDALTHRWCATMPEAVEKLEGDEDSEPFDRDDDEQCGRALRHLLDTVNRGSLFRVVWGMSVMLDPRNRCVDPDADVIEHHHDAKAGMAARQARPLADWHEDTGPVLWWTFPVQEPPWSGQPTDDDWPHYHTHWTPLVIPEAPAVAVAAEAA